MRRMATLVAIALAMLASLAHAQQANLQVGYNCDFPASNTITFACNTNSGTLPALFGTVRPPAGTIAGFTGIEAVVDIYTLAPTLPDWWRADACRSGSFSMAADASIDPLACGTIWDQSRTLAVTQMTVRYPGWGTNMIQLIVDSSLPDTSAYDLASDGQRSLAAFTLLIDTAKSTGPGACAGCSQGACLHLRDVAMKTLSDPSGSVTRLRASQYGQVSYQGVAWCWPDPVRTRTWGMLKSLYR
jgi:hypothetical protein